ncbi:hypothetical protein HPB52_010688 [Rhipicephalus sanguineus]|uniref:Uncharacterized protein n=1 Tax=Rhipicephalus sanguineus TaxID=34632 RepID=A0A9D4Q634_RHISA|nr:hypothetical protein HPB52_010688 [Rhipicephalus sanguineus]
MEFPELGKHCSESTCKMLARITSSTKIMAAPLALAKIASAAAMARLQQKAPSPALKRVAAASACGAQSQRASVSHLQTEDEALAWALQQSLYEAELQGHR